MSIADKLQTIAENEQKVYEAGKEAENKAYWEKFWEGSNGTYFQNYFAGGGWNSENFSKIVYPDEILKPSSNGALYMFRFFNRDQSYKAPLIDLSVFCEHFDFSKCTSMTEMFINARAKNITLDLSSATGLTSTFSSGNGGEIDNITLKVTNKVKTYANCFNYQSALTEIRFTDDSEIVADISFASSGYLTDQSIQSIINALGVVTTSKTITFHSKVIDRLTDEQATQITDKGWNIA